MNLLRSEYCHIIYIKQPIKQFKNSIMPKNDHAKRHHTILLNRTIHIQNSWARRDMDNIIKKDMTNKTVNRGY